MVGLIWNNVNEKMTHEMTFNSLQSLLHWESQHNFSQSGSQKHVSANCASIICQILRERKNTKFHRQVQITKTFVALINQRNNEKNLCKKILHLRKTTD